MIKQSNYRAALDAATAFCLHIGRKRSGASERGCYAPAVQRSPSRLPSSRSCLWPVFGFPKRGWIHWAIVACGHYGSNSGCIRLHRRLAVVAVASHRWDHLWSCCVTPRRREVRPGWDAPGRFSSGVFS